MSDTICSLMWPEVRRQLRAWSKARAEPDDIIHECADDSLLEYLKKPSRYDPHRGSPVAWLVAIGRNKVRDRWRRRARIQALEQPVGVAIERAVSASAQIEDDERERTRATSVELLRLYLSVAQTDEERRFLALHLTRAPLAAKADVLGVGHLPVVEQRRVVDGTWNRLKHRLDRLRNP